MFPYEDTYGLFGFGLITKHQRAAPGPFLPRPKRLLRELLPVVNGLLHADVLARSCKGRKFYYAARRIGGQYPVI